MTMKYMIGITKMIQPIDAKASAIPEVPETPWAKAVEMNIEWLVR
jgi:hypothetical protein